VGARQPATRAQLIELRDKDSKRRHRAQDLPVYLFMRAGPGSKALMPGRKSSAGANHSVSHSEFAPPLAFAKTHSGWYCKARGNCSETSRSSDGIRSLPVLVENPQPDRRLVRRRPINPVLLVGRDVYEVARLHLDGGIL